MSKYKYKTVYVMREWLRHDKSSASRSSMRAHIERTTFKKDNKTPKSRNLNGSIALSDCSRTVEYEFYAKDKEQGNHHIEMLDTLIGGLQKYRDAYKEEIKWLKDKK